MKKTNKTKKFLMITSMLLMISLVIAMGAMTYSRYVSSSDMDSPESATVAEWGYVLSINSENIFGKGYEAGVVNEAFSETEDDKIDVKALASTDGAIVAPGTSGSMTVTVSGQAEVRAQLVIDADVSDVILVYKTSDEGTATTYSPIKWSLTKTTAGSTETLATNETLANVIATLEGVGGKIEAGSEIQETVYTISWNWDINDSTEASNSTNLMDTALGMKAANKSDNDIKNATGLILASTDEGATTSISISIDISATIYQIQD